MTYSISARLITSETVSPFFAASFNALRHSSSGTRMVRSGVLGWLGTLQETTITGNFSPLTLDMGVVACGRQAHRLVGGVQVGSRVHLASAAPLGVGQRHHPRSRAPWQQNWLHVSPSPEAPDDARCLYTGRRCHADRSPE